MEHNTVAATTAEIWPPNRVIMSNLSNGIDWNCRTCSSVMLSDCEQSMDVTPHNRCNNDRSIAGLAVGLGWPIIHCDVAAKIIFPTVIFRFVLMRSMSATKRSRSANTTAIVAIPAPLAPIHPNSLPMFAVETSCTLSNVSLLMMLFE